jgi:hypothetical protein
MATLMKPMKMSPDNQQALESAWAEHSAKLRMERAGIRPFWYVIGWTFGLPMLVRVMDGSLSILSFFWWAVFGYLLVSAWYGYWRERALAGCYMRMSDAFANYVIEKDDLEGALTWQEALAADKRRLKILHVAFPTLQDQDDSLFREVASY